MPKKLIVMSDGTGNRGGVSQDTNVWRLSQMLASSEPDQLTYYDDGVGTSSLGLLRYLGGALGIGISENVRQAYSFLVENYEEHDEIYLFGFSRGGYTVRSLLGFINVRGLVKKKNRSEEELRAEIAMNFRRYRHVDRKVQFSDATENTRVNVKFIGVWDTVDAVGMPIDELKAVDGLVMRLFRRRAYSFEDRTVRGVEFARQALAIDDERRTFHPNYWMDSASGADIEQVWFAGMHSNVGGSYPKDGLAYVTLDWMLAEVIDCAPGIKFAPGTVDDVRHKANAFDKMYDSRSGFGVFYRYSPRDLSTFQRGTYGFWRRKFGYLAPRVKLKGLEQFDVAGPTIKIHNSVLRRIARGTQSYAPLLLPAEGALLAHTKDQASYYSENNFNTALPVANSSYMSTLPEQSRRKILRKVQLRQTWSGLFISLVILTLATIYLVEPSELKGSFYPLKGYVDYVVPDMMYPVTERLFSLPTGHFLLLVGGMIASYSASLSMKKRIADAARKSWLEVFIPAMKSSTSNQPANNQQ